MNSIIVVKVRVSALPINVLTIQTAITDRQNIIPRHLPKNLGQKQPLKSFYAPPKIQVKIHNKEIYTNMS